MPVRLTEALVDSLTPSDRDQFLFDAQLATFAYRLTPAGTGIFYVGKPRRKIGYRSALKVSEAREQAAQMLTDIRQGRDPILERKARLKAAAAGQMTVSELADKWIVLLRQEIFCLVGGNLRAQQGHRGRARASATISR
jgi:hypothetical protein